MYKIIRYLRKSVFIPIVGGILICFLFFLNLNLGAIWLAHIWVVLYFMPITYELSGSFNMAFCCNSALKHEKADRIKKLNLSPFLKPFFCGYDNHGQMLWIVLISQCFFLVYICIFVFFNVLLLLSLAANNVDRVLWMRIWISEIFVQCGIFVIVMIMSYVKDIYFWFIERKNAEIHKSQGIGFMLKRDIKLLRNKKIAKEKNELIIFLKQFGMNKDKHNCYILQADKADIVKESLIKEFSDMYVVYFSDKKKSYLRIYKKKEDLLYIQIGLK